MSNDTRSRPMTAETIHTCSYYCERPECIKRQRDELRDRLEAVLAQQPAGVGVEEMQRRLDREESDHGRTIDQRDAAEDALGRMFQAVTGRPAEWSSAWGYVDAIEEVEEHVATLAQQPAAVDEAMVDRAGQALYGTDWGSFEGWEADQLRRKVRAVLTAALAAQQQEPKS